MTPATLWAFGIAVLLGCAESSIERTPPTGASTSHSASPAAVSVVPSASSAPSANPPASSSASVAPADPTDAELEAALRARVDAAKALAAITLCQYRHQDPEGSQQCPPSGPARAESLAKDTTFRELLAKVSDEQRRAAWKRAFDRSSDGTVVIPKAPY